MQRVTLPTRGCKLGRWWGPGNGRRGMVGGCLPTMRSIAGRMHKMQGMRLGLEGELARHAHSLLVFYFII